MHSFKAFFVLALLSLTLFLTGTAEAQPEKTKAQPGGAGTQIETPNPQTRGPVKPGKDTVTVTEPGDPSKDEVEVTKITFMGKLETVRITYKDGTVRTQSFRSDGTLSSETDAKKDAPSKTTYYKNNGKDKDYELVVSVRILPKGGFLSNTSKTYYRPDGKTPWYTVVSDRTQDLIWLYYGKDGKLKLSRTYGNGDMDVVVFDDNGKEELYRQRWDRVARTGKAGGGSIGYVLKSVTETTADGTKRKLVMKDFGAIGDKAQVEKAEYFKADGTTVDKTVPAGSLSDSPSDERLDEVDRKDDPTVPKTIKLP